MPEFDDDEFREMMRENGGGNSDPEEGEPLLHYFVADILKTRVELTNSAISIVTDSLDKLNNTESAEVLRETLKNLTEGLKKSLNMIDYIAIIKTDEFDPEKND